METSDLFFDLPPELIAQTPASQRGESRLFVYDRTARQRRHSVVSNLGEFLEPETLLVFNDSKVRNARIYGVPEDKPEQEQEFLLVRRLTPDTWLAIGRNSRRLRPGRRFTFPESVVGEIVEIRDEYRQIRFSRSIGDEWLDRHGHIPLPPYIDRPDAPIDRDRYQTVYSRTVGSVAAPTAGLHFTSEILNSLTERGITVCTVTLHVGIGTFFPIRTQTVEDHRMHSEEFYISPAAADTIERARREGRRVVAVGTTSVRTLESAWDPRSAALRRGHQSTNLFIYPGYRFGVVDSIFTNFHTPGSTLLAMISAFTGREEILDCYAEAIKRKYRFFSYGDAMLIL